jgi:putative addiction module component (TIGR02574 family)
MRIALVADSRTGENGEGMGDGVVRQVREQSVRESEMQCWSILPCQPLRRGCIFQGSEGAEHPPLPGSRMASMATADDLLSDALRLPPEERARLAHELLLSLETEGEDSNAEAEWARELERRAQEVISGKVKLVSLEEARRQVAEHLERLRRDR